MPSSSPPTQELSSLSISVELIDDLKTSQLKLHRSLQRFDPYHLGAQTFATITSDATTIMTAILPPDPPWPYELPEAVNPRTQFIVDG
ncbi:hypothetical protein JAAARDRAFT_195071 [Jaapia argillacea MUCL 33604]|uniref:Uncharacterized protein n=1 Tax=Jaapia argillacea MUCL 33604 TaxID=933084 RepID=A0A067PNT3_9AGAM|nr:hypothetical protein JAAARDRAFT_195071 [Jaapia argillacea MUCL 33604]